MRAGIFICIAACLIPNLCVAKVTRNYVLSANDMAGIRQDYELCRKNSGSSDDIMDQLSERMGNVFESILNKVSEIGSKNYDAIIYWASCLTEYSNDGADEELGLYANLCDSYKDSNSIVDRLIFLSKNDKDVGEFRKRLFSFSRNVGVRCRGGAKVPLR